MLGYVVFPYEKVRKNSKVILYGYGDIAKSFIRQIAKNKYCEIIAVVENNPKNDYNLEISKISHEDILNFDYDYIVLTQKNDIKLYSDLVCIIEDEKIVRIGLENYQNDFELQNIEYIPEHLVVDLEKDVPLSEKIVNKTLFIKEIKGSIIDENELCYKLLLSSIKYNRTTFFVSRNKCLVGWIDLHDEKISEGLERAHIIKDLIYVVKQQYIYETDMLMDVLKKIYYFKDDNVAILNENDEIIGITTKMDLYMLCCDIKTSEKEMVFSRHYVRDKQSFINENTMYNHYSQTGEDGIIEHIFKKIGFQTRYCVEFGAWDGCYLSNTKNLIEKYNFKALFIEGDSDRAKEGIKNYSYVKDRVSYDIGYVQHRGENTLAFYLKKMKHQLILILSVLILMDMIIMYGNHYRAIGQE